MPEYKRGNYGNIKAISDEGLVTAVFAVMGNIDEGGDIIHKGAFSKTIRESAGKVRVLDQHKTDSVLRSIGKPVEIREIGRADLPSQTKELYPEATGGVEADIQFFMDTPEGKGAFIRLKEGGIDEWSFGYETIIKDFSKINGKRVRNLKELKLLEISPVLWGMNPATSTVSAKAVIDFQDLPLAGREDEWDGDAAEGRVREWAGGEEPDFEKYALAFFWHDSEDMEQFGAYKLGYADIVGGDLVAVPRGIFAVAAALEGARGGVDIPDEDADRVRSQVSRYYEKMRDEFEDDSIIPPWEQEESGGDEPPDEKDEDEITITIDGVEFVAKPKSKKADDEPIPLTGPTLPSVLMGNIHLTANGLIDKWLVNGQIDISQHKALKGLLGSALDTVVKEMDSNLSTVDVSDDPMMDMLDWGWFSRDPQTEGKATLGQVILSATLFGETYNKAGRVLSAANATKIQEALDALHDVLVSAGVLEKSIATDNDIKENNNERPNESSGTSEGAGPNDGSPTPKTEADTNDSSPDLLRLIEIETEELDLII